MSIPQAWHAEALEALRANVVMLPGGPSEYKRKVEQVIQHPPTPEQIAEYERVKAALDSIIDSEYLAYDDNGVWVEEPTGERETVYAETEEEWRNRVAKLPQYVRVPVIVKNSSACGAEGNLTHGED
jgi:hypothetical protein